MTAAEFIYLGANCPNCKEFVPIYEGRDINVRPYRGTPDIWPYPVICKCKTRFEITTKNDLKELRSEVRLEIPGR